MNEYERKEFERHKKIAEEQINNMYFGANKNQQKSGGISFPSFLSSPNAPHNKVNESKRFSEQTPKNENTKKDSAMQKKKSGGSNSILNFLNFKGMKIDNDRLIILAICILLSGEEADELLMIALIYIML